jgi:hypothetical protein
MRLRRDRQPRPGRPGDREQALIATHGGTETIVMRLDLESVADNAALIIPTPTPATATQAKPALFDELARLSAPRCGPAGTTPTSTRLPPPRRRPGRRRPGNSGRWKPPP